MDGKLFAGALEGGGTQVTWNGRTDRNSFIGGGPIQLWLEKGLYLLSNFLYHNVNKRLELRVQITLTRCTAKYGSTSIGGT